VVVEIRGEVFPHSVIWAFVEDGGWRGGGNKFVGSSGMGI